MAPAHRAEPDRRPSPPPGTDPVALAWHDVTCPEARDCVDRHLHAASMVLFTTGTLHRFLDALRTAEQHP